jgi:hypothetical protein
MIPFVIQRIQSGLGIPLVFYLSLAALLLVFPAMTAFVSLNFTGATPFTSKTGVKMEMSRFIPVMAWLFGTGIVLTIGLRIYTLLGVA